MQHPEHPILSLVVVDVIGVSVGTALPAFLEKLHGSKNDSKLFQIPSVPG